jgi:hypothetical protein
MRDRKHVIRLVGETAREVGTLIFVLTPLDAAFRRYSSKRSGGRGLDVERSRVDRLRYTPGDVAMNQATKQFVIRWLMVDAGAVLLLLWGTVLKYLDKRDQKRQQQPR